MNKLCCQVNPTFTCSGCNMALCTDCCAEFEKTLPGDAAGYVIHHEDFCPKEVICVNDTDPMMVDRLVFKTP